MRPGSTTEPLLSGGDWRKRWMLWGRTENDTDPDRLVPSSKRSTSTAKASKATLPSCTVPSRKFVRPMKPATKRVRGRA